MRTRLEEMMTRQPGQGQEPRASGGTRKAPPSPIPDNNRKWRNASFLRGAMTSGDSLSLLGAESGGLGNQSTIGSTG